MVPHPVLQCAANNNVKRFAFHNYMLNFKFAKVIYKQLKKEKFGFGINGQKLFQRPVTTVAAEAS